MLQQRRNSLTFLLERMLLRGAHYRLLFIAAIIGIISLLGGALVARFGTGMSFGDAVWWAFLRLTDPGYLGDDQGALLRTISTILTVLGYVVFLGALIAIMTQWLNQTIRNLESGLTPIAQTNHILILGWTNRTAAIVRELLLSEGRVRRFLSRRGARALRIVILAEDVSAGLSRELRERLGALWSETAVIFRSGTPLRLEHLQRVDFTRASAILLPAADFADGGAPAADTRTIKTLLSITNQIGNRQGQELPLAVAEIFDARKIDVARRAYGGNVEILASDAIISRLIAQTIRHPGLSHVYGEILTHGRGNEIYIRDLPQHTGASLGSLMHLFPGAILLGVVRHEGGIYTPYLEPALGGKLLEGDRVVLLARRYDDTNPMPGVASTGYEPRAHVRGTLPATERSVLLLGWSHKGPALLEEFGQYPDANYRVDVVSAVPVADRLRALERYGLGPDARIRHVEADYTAPADLEKLQAGSYSSVVFLASDWLNNGEEADARTILGYLLLRESFGDGPAPQLLIELLDPGNVSLFRRRPGEVLISPMLLSHMLAQVALRRELRAVFDELFGPAGAEFHFTSAQEYGIAGKELSFRAIMDAAARRGEVAIGVRTKDPATETQGGVKLNPTRDRQFTLQPDEEVIVLAPPA